MLKILGCALIIGAFGSGGMVAAAYFRRQVAVLVEFSARRFVDRSENWVLPDAA